MPRLVAENQEPREARARLTGSLMGTPQYRSATRRHLALETP